MEVIIYRHILPGMNNVAVITGDLVKSRTLNDKDRDYVLNNLKDAFNEISRGVLSIDASPFEVFRGDSFQARIDNPEQSLLVVILIRAKLRSLIRFRDMKQRSNYETWDARISIGLGSISYISQKTIESDGEAFRNSGIILDQLKDNDERMGIKTPWKDVNDELVVSFSFADSIISKWSPSQAEAVYQYFLHRETQNIIAKELKISQPALLKRLKRASSVSLDLFIKRFNNLILVKK